MTALDGAALLRVMTPVVALTGKPFDEATAAAWLWALTTGVQALGARAVEAEELERAVARAVVSSRWAITPADVWENVKAERSKRLEERVNERSRTREVEA